MRIRELSAYIISVPLRREIQHATAVRSESLNVLVRCQLTDGIDGWGEGVPRQYVTGETPEGAMAQLAETDLRMQLGGNCGSWSDVVAMCETFQPAANENDPRGCYGNALRAAIELSILDAFGKYFQEPVSAIIEHYGPAQEIRCRQSHVHYSTTITMGSAADERRSAVKMRLYRFRQCKVKVGAQGSDDSQRLQRIRRWIGRKVDLRVDANGAWSADDALRAATELSRYNISCIEQPVGHSDVMALTALRCDFPVPIMLDESLTSLADAQHALEHQTCDLFNIRISKCGGFLNSLRLAALASANGLGFQLGCHPGETGVLSAAGRHFATSVGKIRYLEGSYDRHVLRELPTKEDVTFSFAGRAPALRRPGLGITIREDWLRRFALRSVTFRIHKT